VKPVGATPRTRVLLSHSSAYTAAARRLAAELGAAHVAVRHDAWDGGGGVPALQRFVQVLDDVDFVVPLLSPSQAAPTWLGEEWRQAIYEAAGERHIAVLPVHVDGDLEALPAFLRDRSFADLRGRDRCFELRRLLQTLRERSGDPSITWPDELHDDNGVHSPMTTPEHPLTLDLGEALGAEFGDGTSAAAVFGEHMAMMYDGLFHEIGVHFPALRRRVVADLPAFGARIRVNDVPEREVGLLADSVLVNDSVAALAGLDIAARPAIGLADGAPCCWISEDATPAVAKHGLTTWNHSALLCRELCALLRQKAADFVDVDEAQTLLGLIEPTCPLLVAETVPKTVSPFVFTDVLRRLLAEGVSIRNLRAILMALAAWGRVESDPLMLTEYVRSGLKRQISDQFGRGQAQILFFLLDPSIEITLREAMTYTATGNYLDLRPQQLAAIVRSLRRAMAALPPGVQTPVVLTTIEIRSSLRRLVAPSMPQLHVLSYQELRPDIDLQPIGRITLDTFEPRPGVRVGHRLVWG